MVANKISNHTDRFWSHVTEHYYIVITSSSTQKISCCWIVTVSIRCVFDSKGPKKHAVSFLLYFSREGGEREKVIRCLKYTKDRASIEFLVILEYLIDPYNVDSEHKVHKGKRQMKCSKEYQHYAHAE